MKRVTLLRKIRGLGEIDSADRAESIVRAVLDAVRDDLTDEEIALLAGHMPADLRDGWTRDDWHPSGVLEKDEMMFEPGVKR